MSAGCEFGANDSTRPLTGLAVPVQNPISRDAPLVFDLRRNGLRNDPDRPRENLSVVLVSLTDLEDALIQHLQTFLLELGDDFTFFGRQKRLHIDDEWFRIDLVFFHRRLRCLVLIDLKLTRLTAADVGQMHLYLNYARAHWTHADESPPVGLILCAEHRAGVAKYALEGLPNKVLAAEYRMALPREDTLTAELARIRKMLETHRTTTPLAGKKKP